MRSLLIGKLLDALIIACQSTPRRDRGFGYYAEGSDKFGINWMFHNTLEG